MDIQQLKFLAGRVRNLLQQSNHPVGHNQSLDLVAALPGLRNWPEVQAFPDRVVACELDVASASRLAFRMKRKFKLELSPQSILATLSPPEGKKPTPAPQIWPTGPAPGVYVTTSQNAINALLERYEEATDGAVVYAERAGNHWDGSIDLGEYGLWSSGLQRVPSGTLFIVGPLELNQRSWDESARHIDMGCLVALVSGHRVAILIETPTPEAICEDVLLMIQSIQADDGDSDSTLLGVVTEGGELLRREPFAHPRPRPPHIQSVATVDAIPPSALFALQEAVSERRSGLLLFGSSKEFEEHPAIDFVAASLAMTEHAGPAARIMPRNRSTPAKDWQVPEAIKHLPFLPSIESAYDQGYRRMIYAPGYTEAELLLKFSDDVLLIAGNYGCNVMDIFMSVIRGGGRVEEGALFARIVAILGVTLVPTRRGEAVASDLFVMQGSNTIRPQNFEDIDNFMRGNRLLRWEDEMARLLESGVVSAAALKKALPRNHSIREFLSQRASMKKTTSVMH